MRSYILILFLCSFHFCLSQEVVKKKGKMSSSYITTVNEAYKLYKEQKYLESALKYDEAFESSNGNAIWVHLYNAASSYSLAGKDDEAFDKLFKAIEKTESITVECITNDEDLSSLHTDSRWNNILKLIKSKQNGLVKNNGVLLNDILIDKLNVVRKRDQKYRIIYDGVVAQYGRYSDTVTKIIKQSKISDSLNLVEVKHILDTRGWLGKDVIGSNGNMTLFLVIQHADINTQIKYLPMLKEAVKKGNAHGSFLALLEDRIAVKQGKKQIYGSQVKKDTITGKYVLHPIKNPETVNERRKAIGLPDLNTYLNRYGITWDEDE